MFSWKTLILEFFFAVWNLKQPFKILDVWEKEPYIYKDSISHWIETSIYRSCFFHVCPLSNFSTWEASLIISIVSLQSAFGKRLLTKRPGCTRRPWSRHWLVNRWHIETQLENERLGHLKIKPNWKGKASEPSTSIVGFHVKFCQDVYVVVSSCVICLETLDSMCLAIVSKNEIKFKMIRNR